MVDAFHTFFCIAALSLMGHPDLEQVDAMYALPVSVVERITKGQECQAEH